MKWNSPWGTWRHTAVACTGLSPQLTGVSCQSDRKYNNPRYTTRALRGRQKSALACFQDSRDPPVCGTACTLNSIGRTGGTGSRSWRNTPKPFLGVSAAGAKCEWVGSVTATTCRINVSWGGGGASGARPYNADLRQVGSRSISMTRSYHRRRRSHTWGR